MRLAPWEYLFTGFNSVNFPDLFHPTWVLSLVFLVALVVLYQVRTRQLRRHGPYLEMYERLLWTGLATFSMLIVCALFVLDFLFVLATQVVGLGLLAWFRFVRYPPLFEAYAHQLARERYFSQRRFAHPEATIRQRAGRPVRRARRRR
ncbi:MAG TPA: hypothetical protein VNJ28_03455 [Candidatus Limnocylindrales bacterium]|nr:hypothetical protein [Candidatus Limnocylindrales bacterium]